MTVCDSSYMNALVRINLGSSICMVNHLRQQSWVTGVQSPAASTNFVAPFRTCLHQLYHESLRKPLAACQICRIDLHFEARDVQLTQVTPYGAVLDTLELRTVGDEVIPMTFINPFAHST